MYDADLEAYINKKKHIIKTEGEIMGICLGILFGSIVLQQIVGLLSVAIIVNLGYSLPGWYRMDSYVVIILSFLFSIGTCVGISYLPYRTRKNIIKERNGISYNSTVQIFAITSSFGVATVYATPFARRGLDGLTGEGRGDQRE